MPEKNSKLISCSTEETLNLGSARSMASRSFMKLTGILFSRYNIRVWGWNLKKSKLSGLAFRKQKKPSDISAEWNGGTPNANIKKRTPNEKMSVACARQGMSLALWISGAM